MVGMRSTEPLTVTTLDGEILAIPPTDLESDEPTLETDFHREQIEILIACLKWWSRERNDIYASGNLTIYYSQAQIKSRDFRGPDFFAVLHVDPHPRKSWVVWAEDGRYPNVIVEVLSDSTAEIDLEETSAEADRTTKKQLYQDTFRTPEYFWFHPITLEFQGFILTRGQYEPIQPNVQGWLLSQELGLYLGIHEEQLRYFTLEGELIPTPRELAQQAEERAEQAEARLRAAEARLRSLGITLDDLED